jgi:hypothetical protein
MLNLAAGRQSRLEEVWQETCRRFIVFSASSAIQVSRVGFRCGPPHSKAVKRAQLQRGSAAPSEGTEVYSERVLDSPFVDWPPHELFIELQLSFPRRPSSPPSLILPPPPAPPTTPAAFLSPPSFAYRLIRSANLTSNPVSAPPRSCVVRSISTLFQTLPHSG